MTVYISNCSILITEYRYLSVRLEPTLSKLSHPVSEASTNIRVQETYHKAFYVYWPMNSKQPTHHYQYYNKFMITVIQNLAFYKINNIMVSRLTLNHVFISVYCTLLYICSYQLSFPYAWTLLFINKWPILDLGPSRVQSLISSVRELT